MPGPVTIAYYYRTRWGHHEEFVELFTRNHYPILRAQVEFGADARGQGVYAPVPRRRAR